jgi:acyl-CoA thioester hydrolase
MHQHVSRYRVQLFDVNAFGELHATGLLRFMQQTASDASAAAGFDIEWYERHGTIWLIRRTVVEYLTPAVYRDEIAVHTWVSDMRRVRSQREYELHRVRDGQLLARGFTDWVYVETAGGKLVRIPDEVQRSLMPGGVAVHPRSASKPGDPPAHAFRTSRRVEFGAIDSLAHVNNADYATYIEQDLWDALAAHGWALDAFACGGRLRLRSHDIEYFEPALYGDQLTGVVWVTALSPESADSGEPHPLRRSSGQASRRSPEKGPPQGERKLLLKNNNRTARPEEPPFSGGVSKGARWEEPTISPAGFRCEHRLERDGRCLVHAASEWAWEASAMPPSLHMAAAALAGGRG